MRPGGFLSTLLLGLAAHAAAQPNFAGVRSVEDLRVYPDLLDDFVFYYVPGPIRLEESNGTPKFDFLQTRYTGTSSRGDQGTFDIFSQVTVSVKAEPTGADKLRSASQMLGTRGRAVELRPIPIARLDADLVYALPGSDSLHAAGGDSALAEHDGAVWSDRTFTIRLNEAASMTLWEILQEGRAILSFAYGYVAEGVDVAFEDIHTTGTLSSAEFDSAGMAPAPSAPEKVNQTVLADAFPIVLDPARFPEHFIRVDLNGDRVPPGYAALAVRCYDFKDGLRDDLWEKTVEIEAESVAGRPARISMTFSVDDSRSYKQAARFPYAVRLDRPYRYRIAEVTVDGEEHVGPWVVRENWVAPLDVTTPFERVMELRAVREKEDFLEE